MIGYRDRKDTAVSFFAIGLLTGLIVAFASCAPQDNINSSCVENCR